jgi:Protein of unknown function (DUF3050)
MLAQHTAALEDHPLYRGIRTVEALRMFCERHVYCVWDFMSLLKSLQQDITCISLPWVPVQDPEASRLINEIVLGEESDEIAPDRHISHFQWYLEAMEEIGADVGPITRFVKRLRNGTPTDVALADPAIPDESREFTKVTLSFLEAPLHVRAAVFFYGREDLIPRMFLPMVHGLSQQGLPCGKLVGYLQRHIEVDGGHHGPLAEQLIERLIDNDSRRESDAQRSSIVALAARRQLWDSVYETICCTPDADARGAQRNQTARALHGLDLT